ncbi:MAG: tetratricopeptide repeat protein [Bacteroidales bacterium]|nr:tetratricopeptide repeat protein [Bacteroidales bacterium]
MYINYLYRLFLLLGFLIIANTGISSNIDSLINSLEKISDKEKIEALFEIANKLRISFPDSSISYAEKAIKLSKKINYDENLAHTYALLGIIYKTSNKYFEALNCYKNAYDIWKLKENKTKLTHSHNNLGVIHNKIGNYSIALKHHLKALDLMLETKNYEGMAFTYTNLGNVYFNMNNHEKAKDYHLKALKMRQLADNKFLVAHSLNNVGLVYEKLGNNDSALYYYSKSLDIKKEQNMLRAIPFTLNNIGGIYKSKKNYTKALEFYKSAHNKAIKTNNKVILSKVLISLGEVYIKLNKNNTAISYLEQALFVSKEIKTKEQIRASLLLLSEIHSNIGNFEKALEYHRLYSEINNSIFNELESIRIAELLTKHKTNNLLKENEILKIKNELQHLEIIKQQYERKVLIVTGIFVFMIVLIIFYLYRSKLKVNKLLNNKNKIIFQQNQELKDNLDKLSENQQQLIKSNSTKDKLFSIIGHDLLGPVGNMQNLFEFLYNNYDNVDKQKIIQFLKMGVDSSTSTTYLLENLLYWSKSQKDEILFEPVLSNLYEIIENNIDILSGNAKRKSINISFSISKELNARFDINMINTVLRNLISNAIKFTNEDGKINISAIQSEEFIEISVADNGIGIKNEVKEKIFAEAQFFSSFGTNNEKGTGLGLLLCKDFVEKNGGKIWVENNKNKGSIFKFTLPV